MVTTEVKMKRYGVSREMFDEEFEKDEIRSGDVVIFKGSMWRVVSPIGEARYDKGKKIGISILGSPGLGGLKLPRHIEGHCPRERWEANRVEESEPEQTELMV